MAIGLIGTKCGMTRIFDQEGNSTAATVIQVLPNMVAQVKTDAIDEYEALQVAVVGGKPKENKSSKGHLVKAGIESCLAMREFRLDEDEKGKFELGQEIPITTFKVGQVVDVQGISKGKGFAGTVKRHNFRMQDATHGNSLSHRVPGSIGQRQTPGRVFKGKKMSGHMGNVTKTVQNQKVMMIDEQRNILLVSGGVPGFPGAKVIIRPAMKQKAKDKGN